MSQSRIKVDSFLVCGREVDRSRGWLVEKGLTELAAYIEKLRNMVSAQFHGVVCVHIRDLSAVSNGDKGMVNFAIVRGEILFRSV